jgi:hypothetical protein
MAHNYEHNFYVFYINFGELKMVAKNAKIRLPRKNPRYTVTYLTF